MNEISFNISTFTLQIHGLPPMLLYEGMTKKIGGEVGLVHKSYINRQCIVAQRYLRVKIDMEVNLSLLPGFFYEWPIKGAL